MAKRTDKIKLGAFLHATGGHVAGWRHPDAQADAGTNIAHQVELARTAERGLFDLIFFADSNATWESGVEADRRTAWFALFEPLTLLSALAMATQRIGLVATMTTTYNEPYHVARLFASLDHISNGRAGWNLVTSSNFAEAFNYSRSAHVPHEDRYERAREFAAIVLGLWDSWDDDAFVRDKASGVYFDPAKGRALNHKGKHFQVRGPLNLARPPQGHPVIVQAGQSDTGRELAAETAEMIFTIQQEMPAAQAFYADVKARVVRHGRKAEHVKIMPGLVPIVGRSEAEARAKADALGALIHPSVAVAVMSQMATGGFDLSPYDIDAPIPDIPEAVGPQGHQKVLLGVARKENLTIRQLAMRMATGHGHFTVTGSPAQVADVMEEWFVSGACDGFNVKPTHLPGGLNDFVDLVVPELQRRGLFRTGYEGPTLRDNLGLPRPKRHQD